MDSKRKTFLILVQLLFVLCGVGFALAAMTLPEKLKSIPLYPDSKIQQTMDMQGHTMATMEVKAGKDAVLDFYRKSMGAKGWKIIFQAEQEDSSIIHFQKDNQMLHISIQGKDGEETIHYSLVTTGDSP